MRYQLFLSDFDGTLVREDGTVSEANKAAIANYRRAGGIFAVVTGRMMSSILPRMKELGLEDGLAVAYQGAMVAGVRTGELLKSDGFSRDHALKCIRYFEKCGYHVHVYTGDDFFSNMDDEPLRIYEEICRVKGKIQPHLSDMVASNSVKVVFFISSFFKKFNGNLTELSVRENILLLLTKLFYFILKRINCIGNKIGRTAVNDIIITYNFFSELGINVTRCFAVLSCYQILKFLCNHLVSLTHYDIEHGLRSYNL